MSFSECNSTKDVVKRFGRSEQDTGSSEVQIGLLTKKIQNLTEHLKKHTQDKHSRVGLLKMVSLRRSLLAYLQREDKNRYRQALQDYSLRK